MGARHQVQTRSMRLPASIEAVPRASAPLFFTIKSPSQSPFTTPYHQRPEFYTPQHTSIYPLIIYL